MNKRTETAIEVLRNGGYFRKMLERNFRGHEKFAIRLFTAQHQIVKGVGFQTHGELSSKLVRRDTHYGSACRQEWVLNAQVAA